MHNLVSAWVQQVSVSGEHSASLLMLTFQCLPISGIIHKTIVNSKHFILGTNMVLLKLYCEYITLDNHGRRILV